MPTVASWKALTGNHHAILSRFRDDPATWLPPPATTRGPSHYAVTLEAGPVTRLATCAVGDPSGDELACVRRLRWQVDPDPGGGAEPVRSLPSFSGTLTLTVRDGEWPSVRLDGAWEPPRGSVGMALGPAQVRALAEATVDRFVEVVADALVP